MLWTEYKERYPEGYQYSWFCQQYQAWALKLNLSMRREHQAVLKAMPLLKIIVNHTALWVGQLKGRFFISIGLDLGFLITGGFISLLP